LLLVYVFKMDKASINALSNIPLDEQEEQTTTIL
jgi:hypothetical protein